LNRLAVLGHPVAHSRSPAMQNAALEELGLGDEWRYEAIDVEPTALPERLTAMEGEGFAGANITVPHKQAALVLSNEASERARAIGAANTLSFSGGKVLAENTDAPGFLAALPDPPGGKRALVLGAGGAARAVVWALVGAGAEVEIWNRTPERAVELAGELGAAAIESGGPLDAGERDLVVNTTSVGMGDGGLADLYLDPGSFRTGQTVVEIVYGEGETELAAAAREGGATVVDGLEMLVQQGAESLRIWLGERYGAGKHEPPIEAMRAAARRG
jgi:shikimate dehydrogenase